MTNDFSEDGYAYPYSDQAREAQGYLQDQSPVLYELVGSIAVMGARIEDTLRIVFCWLAVGLQPDAQGVVELLSNGQNFSWLLEHSVLVGDMTRKDESWWPALKTAIKQTKTPMEERNGVVHAVFRVGTGVPTLAVRSRLRKQEPETFPATADDLRRRYRALSEAHWDLSWAWVSALDKVGI